MTQLIRITSVEAFDQPPVVREVSAPSSDNRRLLVDIRASALNFADLLKAQGKYQEVENPPFIPGIEGAGVVLEAPTGCEFQEGERIAFASQGTMAERALVEPAQCVAIPDSMDFQQAAAFQIAYGTSHMALVLRGGLKSGDTLAVLGAAGGVGLTAVEIGHALGAKVIGVARGAEKLEQVKAAGADHLIDSAETPDLKAALRDLGGVDVVYDPVGDQPGLDAFGALKRGGRFLVIGFAGGKPPRLPLNHALVKNIAIHGFYWGGYEQLDPEARRNSMAALFKMFEDGALKPHLSHVMPLTEVADAFELLRSRKSVGKIVLDHTR